MGYNTKFNGELRFTKEATAFQFAHLSSMFDEDCRDHPEWTSENLSYVDLELTADFLGIKHNGAEKTYDLEKIVNLVIQQMRLQWPDFGLIGQIEAQGQDLEDRWILKIGDDGMAHKANVPVVGQVIRCPHCEEKFHLAPENSNP
jgi:hypothetical protein